MYILKNSEKRTKFTISMQNNIFDVLYFCTIGCLNSFLENLWILVKVAFSLGRGSQRPDT